MPHAVRYSDIKVPGFVNWFDMWTQFSLLEAGGTDLIEHLPRIDNEKESEYEVRKKIAVDFASLKNAVQGQLDILSLSGIKIEVTNSTAVNDIFQATSTGVDGVKSTAISWLINTAMRTALIYGRAYIVVDRAVMDGTLTERQAEQAAAPYAYILTPLELPAFEFSDPQRRNLSQAITKGLLPLESDQIGFTTSNQPTWTLWTADEIWVQNERGDLVQDVRRNTIGRVPIIKLELNDSFLADLWEPVISMMHHFSMASHGGSNQVYGLLTIMSDSKFKIIDAGPAKALQIGKDDKIQVVNSPVEGLEFNLTLLEKMMMHLKTLFRKRMASMTAKAVVESGVAKKIDQAPQEAFSTFLATSIRDFVPELASLFAAYSDPTKKDKLIVNFDMPSEFVSRDRAADDARAQNLSLNYRPVTVGGFIAQQKQLRDLNGLTEKMTRKEIEDDNKAIEEAAEKAFADLDVPLSEEEPGTSHDEDDELNNDESE